MRGPQRLAMSASSSTTTPPATAAELGPAGSGGQLLGVLVAAVGVGQEDHVRVGCR